MANDEEELAPEEPQAEGTPEAPAESTGGGEETGEVPSEADLGGPVDEEPEPFLIGTWHGMPNYGCPHCEYKTVQGFPDVAWHIRDAHPDA
jgi:hypothetical protein